MGLPKWPQMRVAGPPISADQASEIIRRTDSFIIHGYDGNDRSWNRYVRAILGIPQDRDFNWPQDDASEEERAAFREDMNNHYAAVAKWREDWGCIETEYVHNSWISSSYIGGPYGWCHPDGRIYYGDNVGKWPSPEQLVQELALLATHFPFIDLEAVFMSGESCEDTVPVFGLIVRAGTVDVQLPGEHEFGRGAYHWSSRGPSIEQMVERIAFMPARFREVAITEEQLSAWVAGQMKKRLEAEHDG